MLKLNRQYPMDLRMLYLKSIFSITLATLLVACGGGGDAVCSAGFGALLGSAANCGSNSANAAPVAKTGLVQNVSLGDVTLDGAGSTDANNDTLTEVTAIPSGSKAVLSSVPVPKPTFKADVVGTYSFTLVVNDGKLSSPAVTATVVASSSNSAPVANPGPNQNVNLGAVVYLDGAGSTDSDKDPLTYAVQVRTDASMLEISCKGQYVPEFTVSVPPLPSWEMAGNLLAGGIFGAALDAYNGTGLRYPENVDIKNPACE